MASRTRAARSKAADDLPPVPLPQTFLYKNVIPHDPVLRGKIIARDPVFWEWASTRWRGWLYQDLLVVMDIAYLREEELFKPNLETSFRSAMALGEAAKWINLLIKDGWNPLEARGKISEELLTSMVEAKESSVVLSAILDSGRVADPKRAQGVRSTSMRDHAFLQGEIDNYIWPSRAVMSELKMRELYDAGNSFNLDREGSRIFDTRLFAELATAIRGEMVLKAEQSGAQKDVRRPVIVVNVPNYTGRYANRTLIERMAAHLHCDLVRVDAQDLAFIVGGYLGQDTAYSKGPMSMLGYRAAEMGGRLKKGVEPMESGDSDMSSDIEAAWVNIRQHGGSKTPMEEELQKIKEGSRDYLLPSVDRWENLKINAALERIIQAAVEKSTGDSNALLIQIDNFVELSMTLEGALLLGRLRSIVDDMWRDGKKVVLVGTSANDDPSEQYTATLAELASEESLITFPLKLQDVVEGELKKTQRQRRDYLHDNLRNIHAMSLAMGRTSGSGSRFLHRILQHMGVTNKTRDGSNLRTLPDFLFLETSDHPHAFPEHVVTGIMPCADVHHVARLCQGLDSPIDGDDIDWKGGMDHFVDVLNSRNITPSSQSSDKREGFQSSGQSGTETSMREKAEPERMASGGKYNDFEKKLLTGLVDVKEIKTTFADVHAPPETIAALKLLTSLSLKRPEAFTYGILANDRIPGCLLYGPPGTGKTLLAKAVAKESGASMLEVSGASINDMYVGQSEKNVRALFSLAKKLSPLVIFIDEADALFAARGQSRSRPSHRETINQFLREWDGMSDTKAFIMVATNRPFDLDDAVLRRLPRKILVDLPLQADRAAILGILLKGERLDDSVSVEDISRSTVLYSGSDLKNLCVAAAMAAVQEELEDAGRHEGPEPYVYPERRTLSKKHFDRAAKEIAASISEDMDSLKSIRKFDQKYGDQRGKQKKQRGMGFGVVEGSQDAEDARVRQPLPA